jgi:hypothetical protein
MLRTLYLLSLIVSLLLSPMTVLAQSYADLMREGAAASERSDDLAAIAAFERALALRRTAPVLVQLGLAEAAVGRWVAAEQHLLDARALGGAYVEAAASTIDAALATAQSHLGALMVICDTPGAALTIDGASHALPMGTPLRFLAGAEIDVVVTATGYRRFSRTVRILAGAGGGPAPVTTESVSLSRVVVATVDTEEPSLEASGSGSRTDRSTAVEGREETVAHPDALDDLSDPVPERRDGTGDSLVVGGLLTGLVGLGAIATGIGLQVRFEELSTNYAALIGTECGGTDPPPTTARMYALCLANHQDRALIEPVRNTLFIVGGIATVGGLAMMIAGATLGGGSAESPAATLACGPFADLGISCAACF